MTTAAAQRQVSYFIYFYRAMGTKESEMPKYTEEPVSGFASPAATSQYLHIPYATFSIKLLSEVLPVTVFDVIVEGVIEFSNKGTLDAINAKLLKRLKPLCDPSYETFDYLAAVPFACMLRHASVKREDLQIVKTERYGENGFILRSVTFCVLFCQNKANLTIEQPLAKGSAILYEPTCGGCDYAMRRKSIPPEEDALPRTRWRR